MDGHKITIPVPEGVPNDVKEQLISDMTASYGGCSVTEGRGTYVRDDGSVDDETVTYVSACTSYTPTESEVLGFVEYVKDNSDEECVMWEVTEVSYGFE